jgi:hypothetical protein
MRLDGQAQETTTSGKKSTAVRMPCPPTSREGPEKPSRQRRHPRLIFVSQIHASTIWSGRLATQFFSPLIGEMDSFFDRVAPRDHLGTSMAAHNTPVLHFPARVKRATEVADFLGVLSLFLAPQKNQINRADPAEQFRDWSRRNSVVTWYMRRFLCEAAGSLSARTIAEYRSHLRGIAQIRDSVPKPHLGPRRRRNPGNPRHSLIRGRELPGDGSRGGSGREQISQICNHYAACRNLHRHNFCIDSEFCQISSGPAWCGA